MLAMVDSLNGKSTRVECQNGTIPAVVRIEILDLQSHSPATTGGVG